MTDGEVGLFRSAVANREELREIGVQYLGREGHFHWSLMSRGLK